MSVTDDETLAHGQGFVGHLPPGHDAELDPTIKAAARAAAARAKIAAALVRRISGQPKPKKPPKIA